MMTFTKNELAVMQTVYRNELARLEQIAARSVVIEQRILVLKEILAKVDAELAV
jgi:hypothetical protein